MAKKKVNLDEGAATEAGRQAARRGPSKEEKEVIKKGQAVARARKGIDEADVVSKPISTGKRGVDPETASVKLSPTEASDARLINEHLKATEKREETRPRNTERRRAINSEIDATWAENPATRLITNRKFSQYETSPASMVEQSHLAELKKHSAAHKLGDGRAKGRFAAAAALFNSHVSAFGNTSMSGPCANGCPDIYTENSSDVVCPTCEAAGK